MTMPLSGERPMLTSFWPTASSWSTAFSNFSTIFDIAKPPSKRFFRAFEPTADSCESSHRLRCAPNDDSCDVVAATGAVGEANQTIGDVLRLFILVDGFVERGGDLRVGKFTCKAVG